MKILPHKRKGLKRMTENLSTLCVNVNVLNPLSVGTQHHFIDTIFEVFGSEFRIYRDCSYPLNLVRIDISAIREIKEYSICNYEIIMEDGTGIRIFRD